MIHLDLSLLNYQSHHIVYMQKRRDFSLQNLSSVLQKQLANTAHMQITSCGNITFYKLPLANSGLCIAHKFGCLIKSWKCDDIFLMLRITFGCFKFGKMGPWVPNNAMS